MFKILGVDPGSSCTGYGIVSGEGTNVTYVASGAITLPKKAGRYDKLRQIHTDIARVIEEHAPTHFAIEDVFYNKNPRSTLVLGEARGAAHKTQVNFMLGKILSLADPPSNPDESDALAVAMCHAFKQKKLVLK